MASVTAVRAAIAAVLEAALDDVHVYPKIPGGLTAPAVVVAPFDADFHVAMGRGTDTWNYDLLVLVGRVGDSEAQDTLDGYVTGTGDGSIRKAIFDNRSLGLAKTDAHIAGVSRYGASWRVGEIDYYGAALRLVVHTSGTE